MTESLFDPGPLLRSELPERIVRGLHVVNAGNDHVFVYDRQGFLSAVLMPETLWHYVEIESKYPGELRVFLSTRRNHFHSNGYSCTSSESAEHSERVQLDAELAPVIRRYTERGREIVDLPDDLELDL